MNILISENNKVTQFDLLITFIIIVNFFSILLLSLSFFRVDLVLIASIFSTLVIFQIKYKKYFQFNKHNKHIFFILVLVLIALFFRSEPYKYIVGGQDEGIYVNMSKAYKNYGKVFQYDHVRNNITDSALKSIYDKDNLKFKTHGPSIPHKYEGTYLPGVYIADKGKSEYVFQFYPLFPLWMAIFDTLFGEINAGYALIFFSILSIISFYFLSYEFTKNRNIAFITGVLLAINPLHTFFSKFPVTEVMALAFTSTGFYYLLKYFHLAKIEIYRVDYLMLSALLISGMFFTRMSGFMYIPFFYTLLIINQLFTTKTLVKYHLNIYIFSIFFLYILSVFYGLEYSFPYVHDMYSKSFTRLFGSENYILGMSSIALALLILFFSIFVKNKVLKIAKRLMVNLRWLLPSLLLIIVIISAYKIYTLGFTDAYTGVGWRFERWNAAFSGWKVFLYWSPFVLFEYLSPFVGILFILAFINVIKTLEVEKILLLVFLMFFFIYILLLQWFIPYQYYYARYLLSEVLPYTLLFSIVGSSFHGKYKILFYILLVLAGFYSIFFTILQLKGNVAEGAYKSIKQITQNISDNDLILIEQSSESIKTALVYYENKRVISFKEGDLNYIIHKTFPLYDNLFILTKNMYFNDTFKLEKQITYKFGLFEHTNIIPRKYLFQTRQYNLFRVDKQKLIEIQHKYTNYLDIKSGWFKKEGFYGDNMWTGKSAKIYGLDLNTSDKNVLKLNVYGYNGIYKYNVSNMNLQVYIDNKKLKFIKLQNKSLLFSIRNIDSIHDISISTKTFIPKKYKINNDSRELGIDLQSIELIKE